MKRLNFSRKYKKCFAWKIVFTGNYKNLVFRFKKILLSGGSSDFFHLKNCFLEESI